MSEAQPKSGPSAKEIRTVVKAGDLSEVALQEAGRRVAGMVMREISDSGERGGLLTPGRAHRNRGLTYSLGSHREERPEMPRVRILDHDIGIKPE